MKKILILGFFGLIGGVYAQTKTINCEEKTKELSARFKKHSEEQDKAKISLYNLMNVNHDSIEKVKKGKEIKIKEKDSVLKIIHSEFLTLKTFCGKNNEDKLSKLFKYENYEFLKEEKPEGTITYSYYGDDLLLKEDIVDEETNQGRIYKKVLEKESKSYFGDITIPKNNEVLNFINENFEDCGGEFKYKFKKIDIEIYDGVFKDIRVFIEYKGEIHTYSNYVGINFLRFSERANKNKLFYMQTIKSNGVNYEKEEMEGMYVKLGDIMVYNYKIGNNYIPHDLSLSLPLKDEKNKLTNATSSVNYEIKQSTHLDKILELRAFTDFLALFGEGNNGLVQIEGKAKFYLFPVPHQLGNGKLEQAFFKSVHPYVNYSRFEKGNNFVSLDVNTTTNNYFIENPLNLIERSFLTTGGELDLYEIQHKDYPVNFKFQANYNFQLTRLRMPNNITENVRGIFYGGALDIKTRRFNNFGFNYKVGFSWYDFENYNESIIKNTEKFDIRLPNVIPVLLNQAEVFYHPSEDPNQAIFMRLKIFNYSGTENDNAFYQFQFGYKFSIGSRRVK